MKYIIKKFEGVCPKTNAIKNIEVAYQPTFNFKTGNCLERKFSLCKCELTCPILSETPQFTND